MTRLQALLTIPKVTALEAFCLRILFGFTLIYFLPTSINFNQQPFPVGVARWFDLTWLAKSLPYQIFYTTCVILVFTYISGRWLRVSLPLLTSIQILPYTLINSQGSIGHNYQILSIILIWLSISAIITESIKPQNKNKTNYLIELVIPLTAIITAALFYLLIKHCLLEIEQITNYNYSLVINLVIFTLIACILRKYVNQNQRKHLEPSALTNTWQLISGQTAIAAVYLISVFSKLIISQGQWVMNSHFLALDFVKSTRQSFYSILDPQFLREPFGALYLLEHQNLARLFFGSGLLLEASLFIAVGTRRLSLFFGLMLIAMHQIVLQLMTIKFICNEVVALIFFVNIPFWVMATWKRSSTNRST